MSWPEGNISKEENKAGKLVLFILSIKKKKKRNALLLHICSLLSMDGGRSGRAIGGQSQTQCLGV